MYRDVHRERKHIQQSLASAVQILYFLLDHRDAKERIFLPPGFRYSNDCHRKEGLSLFSRVEEQKASSNGQQLEGNRQQIIGGRMCLAVGAVRTEKSTSHTPVIRSGRQPLQLSCKSFAKDYRPGKKQLLVASLVPSGS